MKPKIERLREAVVELVLRMPSDNYKVELHNESEDITISSKDNAIYSAAIEKISLVATFYDLMWYIDFDRRVVSII